MNGLRQMRRFIRPIRLAAPVDDLRSDPFFIVSVGRSGTTLLRAILTQSPQICIPPENPVLSTIINEFRTEYRYLRWRDVVGLAALHMVQSPLNPLWGLSLTTLLAAGDAIPPRQRNLATLIDTFYRQYAAANQPEALRWGDKSPYLLSKMAMLDTVFPRARFIHLYRDGRDVATSMVQNGYVNNLAEACALWNKRISYARLYPERLNKAKYLEVSYEALVSSPRATLTRICDFLDIELLPAMLQHHEQLDHLSPVLEKGLHNGIQQPIHTAAISNWRRVLSPDEQREVNDRLAPTLRQYGYEVEARS